jgi:hypothetical protein
MCESLRFHFNDMTKTLPSNKSTWCNRDWQHLEKPSSLNFVIRFYSNLGDSGFFRSASKFLQSRKNKFQIKCVLYLKLECQTHMKQELSLN